MWITQRKNKSDIILSMLKDIIPFDRIWLNLHEHSFSAKAVISFINFLERRLGAEFVYDNSRLNSESLELANLFEIAETLHSCGVIRSYRRNYGFSDEPRTIYWNAEYHLGEGQYETAGGSSLDNQPLAFTKMIAETIERNAWFTYDGFAPFIFATINDMEKKCNFLHPKNFASYTETVRGKNKRLEIRPEDSFRWISGYSWTKKMSSWVPAQIVSGHKNLRSFSPASKEPSIRASITTGIATHPVRTSALVSGVLEVIERDAYMITWLNQLSLPRIDLAELSSRNASLGELLKICHQYGFRLHAVRLLTDAPTHAVCVILEDLSGTLPKFSIGLKAHQDSAYAV
ncbi:MAG: YcaO-like family protein, partial [Candidatus Magasanikiibacteriota bacterium]